MSDNTVNFDQVKQFTKDPNVLIVDVREPNELEETGRIDNSINIPLNTLESVLKNTTNDEFNKKYGRNKPDLDQQIVFSCKMGGRAAKAFGIATNLGFKNVSYYKGSWTEWEQKLKDN